MPSVHRSHGLPTPHCTIPSPEHITGQGVNDDALSRGADFHQQDREEVEEVGGGETAVHVLGSL